MYFEMTPLYEVILQMITVRSTFLASLEQISFHERQRHFSISILKSEIFSKKKYLFKPYEGFDTLTVNLYFGRWDKKKLDTVHSQSNVSQNQKSIDELVLTDLWLTATKDTRLPSLL